MSDTPESESIEITSALPRLGEVLRETREGKGLSIDDVSNRLRLGQRQIKALEDNHFQIFPESVMARGFIRNYARFLEIDSEPLLQAYRVHVPNDAPHALSIQSANVLLPSHQQRNWAKYLLIVIVLVLVAGGWFFYSDFLVNPKNSEPAHIVSEKSAEPLPENVAEPMPQPALPLAERTQEVSESEVVSLPQAQTSTSPATKSSVAEAHPSAAQSQASSQPVPSTQPIATKALPAGVSLKVKFILSEQSWISVIDGAGNQIFNKTKAAGSSDEVEGTPPLKLIIGNAAGTQVVYREKALDLAPYSRLNVARLTLNLE